MEVRVGVQHIAREITFETDAPEDEVLAAVAKALENDGELRLSDSKGRQLIVVGSKLAYVQLGESEKGRVGFGTRTSAV